MKIKSKINISSKSSDQVKFLDIQKKDAYEDTKYLKNRFKEIERSLKIILKDLKKYQNYCATKKLHIDKPATIAVSKLTTNINKIIESNKNISLDPQLSTVDYGKQITEFL